LEVAENIEQSAGISFHLQWIKSSVLELSIVDCK
jgi:hypothetical protein